MSHKNKQKKQGIYSYQKNGLGESIAKISRYYSAQQPLDSLLATSFFLISASGTSLVTPYINAGRLNLLKCKMLYKHQYLNSCLEHKIKHLQKCTYSFLDLHVLGGTNIFSITTCVFPLAVEKSFYFVYRKARFSKFYLRRNNNPLHYSNSSRHVSKPANPSLQCSLKRHRTKRQMRVNTTGTKYTVDSVISTLQLCIAQ